ncbi:hypothetical protein M9Y10_002763 [Tritrichomonas musculus]|uniref:Charged multivesicular body protein 7 n=1 Tax=Tritrichomonas musculus TaxID=1915356 RepID=A0ABR2LBM1_9EUKA
MDYNTANSLLAEKLEDIDGSKVDSLFANLRSKDKDSKKWKDQVKFWSRIIKNWGNDTDIVEFSVDTLTQHLTYNGLKPQIKPALDYLVSIGLLKTHEDVVTKKSFLGSLSSKIFGFVWPSSSNTTEDKYVFVDNLKSKVKSIISEVERDAVCTSDIILTDKDLESRFKDDSKYPFDLILNELEKSKQVKKLKGGYYFEVGHFSEYRFDDEVIQRIIETKETIRLLDEKIDLLDKQMDYYLNLARSYKKQNRLKEAKSALAHKKIYENQRDKFDSMRMNLQNTIYQFEGRHDDMRYINLLKSTNDAMKNIGMPSIEDVDNVMDEIQDMNEVTDQIACAIQQPGLANMDDEIEDEFLNLPTGEEQPQHQHQPQSANIQYQSEAEMLGVPQAEPARLKKPKQLANNHLLQYY